MRPKVWCLFASSYDLRRKNEGIFELCLKSNKVEYDDPINADVKRTLPDHPLFTPNSDGLDNYYFKLIHKLINHFRQNKLFDILKAYSSFNPSIGYVQCMNFIAGYMYTQIKSSELTFWTFVSIMQSIKGLFAEGLPLLNISIDIFNEIIKKRLPVLFAHFVSYTH